MPESPAAPTPAPRRRIGCFVTLALLVLAIWFTSDRMLFKLASGMNWLTEQFQQQSITEVFRENVRRIASTNGDVLELATLETEETVTKFDTKSLFSVYLGTTVSEIRAMVVYRYHLKLSDDWNLTVENGRCLVLAPAIRPSLPPAIRTDTMEKKSEAGWLRFNAAENLVALEKGFTPLVERRAAVPGKINSVREAGRQSVAKFVQQWLIKEQQGHEQGGIREIVVIFPDEAAAKNPAEALKLPATLILEVKAH